MKRAAHSLFIGALVLSAALVPSTSASGGLIEAVDAGVTTSSPLSEISPAGNMGVFAVTATLSGPTPASINITDSVGGGTIEPSVSNLDACAGTQQLNADGTQLTCRVELSPEQPSATIHVTVRSALSATQVFNHAAVSMQGEGDSTVVGIDADSSNDQASATVPVTAANASVGFVPEGGSLSYQANGQSHVLTVTEAKGAGGGALVSLSDPGQMDCSGAACNGVRIFFYQGEDGATYEAATQLDSAGDHDPCRGLGADKCTGIYWRKTPADLMALLPACGTEGPTDPCLSHKYKTDGGQIHYATNMDTDDPDIGIPGIPPIDAA